MLETHQTQGATSLSFFKGKKVFITGHTGFKGAWLSQWLLNLGCEVAGYSIGIPTDPSLFEGLGLSKHMVDLRKDVRDFNSLRKAIDDFKPQILFHMAAQSLVSEGYLKPKETFDINVGGAVNIFEALKLSSSIKSAIIATSDKCYKKKKSPCVESDPLGGDDPYSASKACVELAFNSYATQFEARQIGVATVRGGNVFGGGDWTPGRLIPDCVYAKRDSKSLRLRNSSSIRSWVYILDILSGYLTLAQELFNGKIPTGSSFNFGGLEGCTVKSLVENFHLPIEELKEKSFEENDFLLLDSSKAKKVFGWQPRNDLAQGIKETLDWYEGYFADEANVKSSTSKAIKKFEALIK